MFAAQIINIQLIFCEWYDTVSRKEIDIYMYFKRND